VHYSHQTNKAILRKTVIISIALSFGVMGFFIHKELRHSLVQVFKKNSLTKYDLQKILASPNSTLQVRRSLSIPLQVKAESLFKLSKVHYGSAVVMNAKTGEVLALYSYGNLKDRSESENLALRATFPAASIFKVITAAAAVESGKLKANSMIPVRGSFHTLYKQNLFKSGGIEPTSEEAQKKSWRAISLEDALAKSVNSVFGKVGIFGVGAEGLRKTAEKFLFGSNIPFEYAVEPSIAYIPNDGYALAESASGFNRFTTLSPLHGALIGAAVINNGTLMEPSIVQEVVDPTGQALYSYEPKILSKVVEEEVALELQQMMHRTVIAGTSRRSFRSLKRSSLSEVFVGGKTGTLNGKNPPGRYDWFVGFGELGDQKVSVSVLCIHGPLRGAKASSIARTLLETHFQREILTKNE
jgi:peptidoglycan glycosyltransferase